jgi:hypothetical protein
MVGHSETIQPMVFTGLPVGLLLLLVAASVEDFPGRLSYPLGASFADLARTFSGADADVLSGSRGASAEIRASFARMQSSQITGRSGSALAQAPRSLGCASANVLTALAHILARAGPGFLLILLRLVLRPGLRLGGPLILRWIRGAREGGQTQENGDARHHKNRGELGLSFHFLSPADGFKMTITSYAGLMLLTQVGHMRSFSSELCAIFLNSKGL